MFKSCLNCKYLYRHQYENNTCLCPELANYDLEDLRTTHPYCNNIHPNSYSSECDYFKNSVLSKIKHFTFPLRLWIYKMKNNLD